MHLTCNRYSTRIDSRRTFIDQQQVHAGSGSLLLRHRHGGDCGGRPGLALFVVSSPVQYGHAGATALECRVAATLMHTVGITSGTFSGSFVGAGIWVSDPMTPVSDTVCRCRLHHGDMRILLLQWDRVTPCQSL